MFWIWLLLFLTFLILEVVTVSLVSIWFCGGAIAAMISSYFTDSLFIQILVFIVVSVILLAVLKPLFKHFRISVPTNYGRVIGKSGVVTEEISEDKYGQVKVDGSIWTAKSKEKIKKDEKVKVLDVEGVKLIVEREEK